MIVNNFTLTRAGLLIKRELRPQEPEAKKDAERILDAVIRCNRKVCPPTK